MCPLTPPPKCTRWVYTSHSGISLNSISGPYGRFLLAGARATVIPGASSGPKPMQHPGEELVHVLSGVLDFTVTGQPYRVEVGSSLHSGVTSHIPGAIPAASKHARF
jgi:quercetin dioxygenase-like cupin family protein